ncbi:MAG: PaaI family thioesterase [Spirochaetales bacterium]|nr:PaaI family thioesterase [Spirochaetales bacterium]
MICGDKTANPHTLHLRFRITGDGVETVFVPDEKQEGFKGIVHGGIVASLLDETIGWSIAVARKKYFMTVELNIRFLKSLPVGKRVKVKGWPVIHKRRSATGEGIVQDSDGTIYAKASAKFFLMADEQARSVHEYLTFREDDIDILSPESGGFNSEK